MEVKERILKILRTVPKGVLYSTTDWHRILKEDKRKIRNALRELEDEGRIEIQKSGRPDKPLYRLREE
ncbi:hypothetical protein E0L93_01465 [Rubrobacter taiwanensis]|uniref:Uncharacterized protein n=1 Tax=Rubrobacter taiwanensis TaxID=185139 RepID=A0A4R1BRV4_9ACTN|nr:hypothetical protein [Rubrobacter taiwanensis]TCJ20519.1 hypothetical protein E0L93_01465 [Rubrobacter taiwanensis]